MTPMCLMLLVAESLTCPLLPADPMMPLDEPQLYAVLERAGWPEPLWQEAASVAWCESGWTAGARNGVHLGLYQINLYWDAGDMTIFTGWADWLEEEHDLSGEWQDPVFNAMAARLIYEHNNGWAHNWAYCSS